LVTNRSFQTAQNITAKIDAAAIELPFIEKGIVYTHPMGTPNNVPNANSGRRSLAELLWQSRKPKKAENLRKDGWDKADIIARWLIAIAAGSISVLVAIIGGNIQQAVTSQTGKIQQSIAEQNTGKDYMQMAFGILEKKDLTEDMQKNKGLRKWAVDLLQYYSPVKLGKTTADQGFPAV
jgi:hypothetical protein